MPDPLLPDPELRETVKATAETLLAKADELEQMNQDIIQRLQDLQTATVATHMNQAKFLVNHEKTLDDVTAVLDALKQSVSGLNLQVRDLRSELKKDKPTE